MKKIALASCLAALLLSGCLATNIAEQHRKDTEALIAAHDQIAENFAKGWDRASGLIDGYYLLDMQVPNGLSELKRQIDKILLDEKMELKKGLTAYEKSKAVGIWGNLVTKEIARWIRNWPDLLKLIPVGLL